MLRVAHLRRFRQDLLLQSLLRQNRPPSTLNRPSGEAFLSFYDRSHEPPFVPVIGHGPWLITNEGSVIYDTGGYGMLGFGHNPMFVLEALRKKQVMANIMTPSESQTRFGQLMAQEIGHTRPDKQSPYSKLMCLNSGSEVISLALRLANVGQKGGKPRARIALARGFHGRTDGPARVSDSCWTAYDSHLASFERDGVHIVRPNDKEHFLEALDVVRTAGQTLELVIMEPVMGEGEPGLALDPEYYALVRTKTKEMGALLLIDSVQAGFRCRGHLSVVDYPGMQTLAPPDMETFSKALNAGQFPLSVLALSDEAVSRYRPGLYGNTMTATPRALDVGSAVLSQMNHKVRSNINAVGLYLKERLDTRLKEYDSVVKVAGTGLLIAVYFDPEAVPAMTVELSLRLHGLNVIHGGSNSIRLTPWFYMSTKEADLVADIIEEVVMGLI